MNEVNPEQKPEIEKPPVLYHASPNRKIEEFVPRAETFRDPNEGPVVFATPDKAYASCFIVPKTTDEWCQVSVFDNSLHVMIISDEKRFKRLDKGGTIYSLPSETFETDLEKSKTSHEWTSKESVKPSNKTEYKTGFQAMLENGVRIYFVSKKIFGKIRQSEDHGRSVIEKLEPEK